MSKEFERGCLRCCLTADKLLVQQDPSVYYFISQGCLTVDNMNDSEEMDMVEVRLHYTLY